MGHSRCRSGCAHPVVLAVAGLAVVLTAAVTLVGRASPASAHAELVSSEPAAGAQLDVPPQQVVLRFTEAVDIVDGGIEVLTTEGDRLDTGEPRHLDGRSSVAVDLPDLDDGRFVVAWRVVSSDSHPVSGAFTFRVGDAPAGSEADDDTQALVDDALAGTGADRAVGVAYGLARFATFAGLVVLVGGGAFVLLLWPAGAGDARVRRILSVAWWVALAATLVSIPVHGAYALGGSLADALDWSTVADELDVRTGRVWLLRLALLLAVAVVGPRLARRARTELRRRGSVEHPPLRTLAVALGAGLALLATVTFTGHAVSGEHVGLAVVTDVVHLGAVSGWLGGLAILLGAVLRPLPGERRGEGPAAEGPGPEPAGEGAAPDGPGPEQASRMVAAFSDLAFLAVVVIVASGVVQAWRQLGSWDALVDTDYGRLLLVKVAAVALLLAAASVSRSLVRGRATRRPVPALSPGPGAMRRTGAGHQHLARLRRSVGVGATLAAVVLAVTALLVNAVPGRTAIGEASASGSYQTVVHGSTTMIQISVDPVAVGPVDIDVVVRAHDGSPLAPEEVTASLTLPERDIGPLDVPLTGADLGHYRAEATEIPFPGSWELEVVARTSDIDQDRVTAEIAIP